MNPKTATFSWKNFFHYYLFFFYFSGCYQILVVSSGHSSVGLRQAILMSFLWLIPILFLSERQKIFAAIIGLFLWLTSLVSMGYFALYEQEFSQSVLFIIFESNFVESSEFMESYFRLWMIPAFILYSVIPFFLWKTLKPFHTSIKARNIAVVILSIIVFWPFLNSVLFKHKGADYGQRLQMTRMEPAAPWHLVMGYLKYKKTLHEIEQHLLANKHLPPLKHLTDKNKSTNNTLVLVIGESTNQQRMSLYGYSRDTTPQLNQLKDELLIFKHVYSPRPYTIETLQQVLTFADQKHPNLYLKKPTLINLMKQAGYKIYWITNQQTQTKRNTMLTTFSQQADEQVYLNNNRSQNSPQYDGVVIKPFKKMLEDNAPKKMIIVHLLGTHRSYFYRFPDNYAPFNNKSDLPKWSLSENQQEEYNAYDNAIYYNDFVVASLINTFKESQPHGLLLYFSDHGEEVYDNPEDLFTGRNEGDPTSPMYTIPFIVWSSPSWQKDNPIKYSKPVLDRMYGASNFIHTWADLSGLKFDDFDPTKSIVNPLYQQHPVWIGDPFNSDTLRDLTKKPFKVLP